MSTIETGKRRLELVEADDSAAKRAKASIVRYEDSAQAIIPLDSVSKSFDVNLSY